MASKVINSKNIQQELMNVDNWKSTRRKNYAAWVCRPELKTTVVDVTTDYTYSTNKKEAFILSGTVGELRGISASELSTMYTFTDGVKIDQNSLQSKVFSNGQLEWTRVVSRLDLDRPMYAFHVPTTVMDLPITKANGKKEIVNWSHIKNHGKGDFIICPSNGGSPDFSHLSVVNGEVFPRTYTLTSFKGLFDTDEVNIDPEKPVKELASNTPVAQPKVTEQSAPQPTEKPDPAKKSTNKAEAIKSMVTKVFESHSNDYKVVSVETRRELNDDKKSMKVVAEVKLNTDKGLTRVDLQFNNDNKIKVTAWAKYDNSLILWKDYHTQLNLTLDGITEANIEEAARYAALIV
jgi:hypothetical protein